MQTAQSRTNRRPAPWPGTARRGTVRKKGPRGATPNINIFPTTHGYSAAAITSPKRRIPSRMVSASALVKFRRMVERAPGSA